MASVLKKTDHKHPFAPFLADDVARIKAQFLDGFDALFLDENGATCLMAAAGRGNAEAAHLALSLCPDPKALAAAKNRQGIDAFDIAAERGATAAMAVISKHLPTAHVASSGHGFLWHAAQASKNDPNIAEAWLLDLCIAGEKSGAVEALSLSLELGWEKGTARLRELLSPES